MTVDLTGVAISLATAVFAVAAKIIRDEIRAHVTNKFAEELIDSMASAALGVMQRASEDQISHASALHPDLNPLLAVGVHFMLNHAAEAITHRGLTPDLVAQRIEAKIGLANIATNLAVAASPVPAVPAPLDPLPATPSSPGTTSADLNNAELARIAQGR